MLTKHKTNRLFMKKTLLGIFLSGLLVAYGGLYLTYQPAEAASGYLHTSGSKIMDSSNTVVALSGLNWFGFETPNYAPHGLWSRNWQELLDQIKNLGYNVIRLPYSDAMLQPNVTPNGIDYTKNPDLANLTSLQVMDKIIAGAGKRGIKVILDNHRSTPGAGPEGNGLWYTNEYPESRWIADWEMLVRRYLENDTVVGVDLRNEPHDAACWGCGDPAKDWRLAAEKAGNAILAINPNLLIIVEGVSNYNGASTWWGGNLMGAKDFPVRLSVPGRLVYSPHEYPASVAYQPWFNDPGYPNNLPEVWNKYWGYLVKENLAPILIGEFGTRYQTPSDQQWMQSFDHYIHQNGLSWTFWSLNPNSGDTGGLLLDNWTNIDKVKQDLLKQIQYPMLASGSQLSATIPNANLADTATPPPAANPMQALTATPASSLTPAPSPGPTEIPPALNLCGSSRILDGFTTGSNSLWNTFQDAGSAVNVSIVPLENSGNYALRLDYRLGPSGWGGVGQSYEQPQDWSAYSQLSFQFYGTNTGNPIRLELLGDRAACNPSDTSERFIYQFTDNFNGWKTFVLPWSAFTRRTDWQPGGAPNNNLDLTQIWGFNFSPITGSGVFQVFQVQLIKQVSDSGCIPR